MTRKTKSLSSFWKYIQQLKVESPLSAHLSTQDAKLLDHFDRQLNDMERNLRLVKEEIMSLTPGRGLDSQLEEQVSCLKIDL